MLHEWIAVFGDSLFAMRAMSAALGTIAIVLVFVAVREICRSLADEPTAGRRAWRAGGSLRRASVRHQSPDGAVGPHSEDVSAVMCAELLQITFFVRAQRRGGMLNYVGIAVFTAAMVACNFTSIFLMVAEALWLGWLLLAALWDAQSRRLAVFRPGCARGRRNRDALPWLHRAFASSRGAVEGGAIDWIKLQPISWPYTTLRDSTGNHTLFWIFVALAAFGVWRQWRSARLVVEFFALWTAGPILAVMAVTYLYPPAGVSALRAYFVRRYVRLGRVGRRIGALHRFADRAGASAHTSLCRSGARRSQAF